MTTEEQPPRVKTRYRTRGCGCGFGGFILVLTVGILLSLFNAILGIGLSVRIPLTQSNLTVAGSLGKKSEVVGALPSYTEGRLAGNQNLFNYSTTMTIGPAEGAAVVILGHQDGAPPIDVHLAFR